MLVGEGNKVDTRASKMAALIASGMYPLDPGTLIASEV